MKTVVITGASRGIGKALAERFLAHGDFVIGSSRESYPNSPKSKPHFSDRLSS